MLTFAGKNSLTFFGEGVADSGPEEVIRRIRNHGGIDEGMDMYKNFRGKEPDTEPLLKNRGLK